MSNPMVSAEGCGPDHALLMTELSQRAVYRQVEPPAGQTAWKQSGQEHDRQKARK